MWSESNSLVRTLINCDSVDVGVLTASSWQECMEKTEKEKVFTIDLDRPFWRLLYFCTHKEKKKKT